MRDAEVSTWFDVPRSVIVTGIGPCWLCKDTQTFSTLSVSRVLGAVTMKPLKSTPNALVSVCFYLFLLLPKSQAHHCRVNGSGVTPALKHGSRMNRSQLPP